MERPSLPIEMPPIVVSPATPPIIASPAQTPRADGAIIPEAPPIIVAPLRPWWQRPEAIMGAGLGVTLLFLLLGRR